MKPEGGRRRAQALLPAWLIMVAILLLPAVRAAHPEAVPVTVKNFDTVKVFPEYTAPGVAVSLNDSQISAEVGGVIAAVMVKTGDTVEAGETLVRLDCRDHELAAEEPAAQLQSAKAQRDLAGYRNKRAEILRKRGVMPLEEVQQRKAAARRSAAAVRRLRAQVAESKRVVAKCEIRAPFRAVVVARLASVGEFVQPGMHLLRLVDTQAIEVSSQIQEQDLDGLRHAARVEFVSRGTRYPLALRSVVPVLDRRVSSYEARFEFGDQRPAPGQSGRVEWRAAQPRMPADLLVQRHDVLGVFLAVGGRARFRALAHASPGQPALAPLAGDAKLIVDGRYGLEDGQAITLVGP